MIIKNLDGKVIFDGSDLREANLRGANLREANLREANLREANLCGANLRGANLREANLREANLREANLCGANLCGANLCGANLCGADLCGADLRGADLRGADLRGADLRVANLCGANLSGATGLMSQTEFISQFETDCLGIIVYKSFGDTYGIPTRWKIQRGSAIEEVVNPDRATSCGCGINFATARWVDVNTGSRPVWKCRIAWKDLAGVVVPYGSDGKARCERLTLIRSLSDKEFEEIVSEEKVKSEKD